jgi:hypothetical protein
MFGRAVSDAGWVGEALDLPGCLAHGGALASQRMTAERMEGTLAVLFVEVSGLDAVSARSHPDPLASDRLDEARHGPFLIHNGPTRHSDLGMERRRLLGIQPLQAELHLATPELSSATRAATVLESVALVGSAVGPPVSSQTGMRARVHCCKRGHSRPGGEWHASRHAVHGAGRISGLGVQTLHDIRAGFRCPAVNSESLVDGSK